jgi:hypothetical protein
LASEFVPRNKNYIYTYTFFAIEVVMPQLVSKYPPKPLVKTPTVTMNTIATTATAVVTTTPAINPKSSLKTGKEVGADVGWLEGKLEGCIDGCIDGKEVG